MLFPHVTLPRTPSNFVVFVLFVTLHALSANGASVKAVDDMERWTSMMPLDPLAVVSEKDARDVLNLPDVLLISIDTA